MKKLLTVIIFILFSNIIKSQNKKTTDSQIKSGIEVVKVTPSADGTLSIDYYKASDNLWYNKSLKLLKGDSYNVTNISFIPKTSIFTTPFKVRPAQENVKQSATSSLKNASLNFSLITLKWDRYFYNNTQSKYNFSAGIFVGPNVEELNAENTDGQITIKSSQLFMSTGLSLIFSYNGVAFTIIPLGFDIGTTTDSKKFIYNEKNWFGIGIGIDSKLLNF